MSNYQSTADRISIKVDSHHISRHSFFTGLKNHWNSVSGFNTQNPYAGLNERTIFREKNPDRSALFDSFDILVRYIDDILALKPDIGNHDINLKTQLEIKKTEMDPLLPDSCLSLSYDDRGGMFSVYQMVIKIHSDLLALQDLFQIHGDFSRYSSALVCERAVIETALSSIRRICTKNSQDSKSIKNSNMALLDASHEYRILMAGLKQNQVLHSGNLTILQIMKKLTDIGRKNEKLCGRLMTLSRFPETEK
ncbi:MAG: hypothetical protein DRZ90_04655 [Spirochaetes bacterium]|nr:MAG: hypothetical protein DRP60_01135 [Spirochaetota bacterium]RKX97932.1 MAG: hypothetical protein DRZ90_04655 [Spirochaetota bacterium]